MLWAGLLPGPIAWAVQLLAVYATSRVGVRRGAGLAAASGEPRCACLRRPAAAYLGWRDWRAIGGWPGSADESDLGRDRLMAVLGIMTGTLFSS